MASRALHFVFKIGNRKSTIDFLKNVMEMKVLRHEEFGEGCKAYCNGPYDGKWSKTMIGYGPEINHFVLELTYNYGIGSYKLGNDFQSIHIDHPSAFKKIMAGAWPIISKTADCVEVQLPDGYRLAVWNRESKGDPIKMVVLSCSDLNRSVDYWSGLCGMQSLPQPKIANGEVTLAFSSNQCLLKLVHIRSPIDHASAFGRIAFACPQSRLGELQKQMEANQQTILKPLISLDTPGKATVEVIILADPDGHEICFVGGEAFNQLSEVDPKADELLVQAVEQDKSDEWFRKHGGKTSQ